MILGNELASDTWSSGDMAMLQIVAAAVTIATGLGTPSQGRRDCRSSADLVRSYSSIESKMRMARQQGCTYTCTNTPSSDAQDTSPYTASSANEKRRWSAAPLGERQSRVR